jgi:protein tyrosine/serine phosphatase
MQYISIPAHCPFPRDKPWARFLEVIRENRGRKVFVHCRLGDDRTGLAVAVYRIADEGWSADEALREMKAFGFSGVHHMICPGMAAYVRRFPERLKIDPAFRKLANEQNSK